MTIEVTDTGEGIAPDVPAPHLRAVPAGRRDGARQGRARPRPGHRAAHRRAALRATCAPPAAGSGRGATFTVQLPSIAERPVPAVAARRRRAARSALRSHDITVLVVDDQEDARELMCAVLGRCGAHVVAVGSTAAALEAMDRCHPDVVLSDLEMPGEDGYSLIKKIRARSRGARGHGSGGGPHRLRAHRGPPAQPAAPASIVTCPSQCSRMSWPRSWPAWPAGGADQGGGGCAPPPRVISPRRRDPDRRRWCRRRQRGP